MSPLECVYSVRCNTGGRGTGVYKDRVWREGDRSVCDNLDTSRHTVGLWWKLATVKEALRFQIYFVLDLIIYMSVTSIDLVYVVYKTVAR